MAKIIAVTNQKGGVGKTTTANNLSVGLAKAGYKVVAIDGDPQGNLTSSFGMKTPDNLKDTLANVLEEYIRTRETDIRRVMMKDREGVDLIPANVQLCEIEMMMIMVQNREKILKKCLQPLMDEYDYIIIDCPPALNILTINIFAAADKVIIPVQTEFFAALGMIQLIRSIHNIQSDINPNLRYAGILLTLYDKRTNVSLNVKKEVEKNFGNHIRIYDSIIPRNVKLSEAQPAGQSIFSYSPRSKGAVAYQNFVKEFLEYEQA